VIAESPSLATALLLGFLLGIRHAMDADHLAAVSVFVSQHRSVVRACLLGTCWGAGHTLSLLVAGLAVVLFKLTIPPHVERGFELVVACVLVLLGGHVLLKSTGTLSLHGHEHWHGVLGHTHRHPHGSDQHTHLLRFGYRPFLMGILHGMAGSAALTVVAVATIQSSLGVMIYVLVFGLGSTGGMLVLGGVMAVPLAAAAGRADRVHTSIQVAVGMLSLMLGLWLLWHQPHV